MDWDSLGEHWYVICFARMEDESKAVDVLIWDGDRA